jgi:hypothetical protein
VPGCHLVDPSGADTFRRCRQLLREQPAGGLLVRFHFVGVAVVVVERVDDRDARDVSKGGNVGVSALLPAVQPGLCT